MNGGKQIPFQKRDNPLSRTIKPIHAAAREKYTATMESELRKRVKIACATRGIQFSQLIEEALLEKLEREGF